MSSKGLAISLANNHSTAPSYPQLRHRWMLITIGLVLWYMVSWQSAHACDLDGSAVLPAPLVAAGAWHVGYENFTVGQTAVSDSGYGPSTVRVIDLGAAPHGVAVSPDGSLIYVTDFTAQSLSIIDAATSTVLERVPVGRGAVNVIVTADGSRAFVSNELDDTLSVIDTSSRTVVKTLPLLDRPHGMALGADPESGVAERWLYVANLGSDQLSIIDTNTLAVHTHVAVGNTPDSPVVSPDGREIWVTNYGEGEASTLSLIDGLALTTVYTLPVGIYPHGIKLAPMGDLLYVTLQGEDKVLTVETATRQILDTTAIGNGPHGLGLSPDGRYLWTGDLVSRTSTIIDSHSGLVIAELATGITSNPHTIAFAPDGYTAYISDFTGRRLLIVEIGRPTSYLPLVLAGQ